MLKDVTTICRYIRQMGCRTYLVFSILVAVAVCVFLPGINWGLPSQDVDQYLFGNQPVWTGAKILQLAGPTQDPNRGADVASHASANRRVLVQVNATDEDRARIVRRYRLMSYQPDEWNTLKALSEMKPGRGDLDPKLYQYGGLWVYPVGAMLKGASIFHVIDVRSDVAWYLDHPEAFGRFYIVARLWSVTWAVVGVFAVHALVRRIVGGCFFPTVASLCFIFMPVVVNMAHEAKPHLAGAVLMLQAGLAAARYVEQGTRKTWMLAGALCGAALGMVLSSLPIFSVLAIMVLMRRSSWPEKLRVCAGATAIGLAVYAITNPYVPYHFLFHHEVLQSNLGNSTDMYHPRLTVAGIANTAYLLAVGTSPVLAFAGAGGALLLGLRAFRVRTLTQPAEIRRRSTGILLAVPAVCVAGQWMLLATAKPGEFGRFLLVPDLFLMIEAVVAVATFVPNIRMRGCVAAALTLTTVFQGVWYVRAFVRDGHRETGRLVEAQHICDIGQSGARSIAVMADPAPYCLPPVDLFRWKILLLPREVAPSHGLDIADLFVQATDLTAQVSADSNVWTWMWLATPISWADKPFDVQHWQRAAKDQRRRR